MKTLRNCALLAALALAACSGSCGGSGGGGDDSEDAAVCGNTALESSEECDDGNTNAGDCCSAQCQFEAAGSACDDGLFCTGTESCNGAGSCDSSGDPCSSGTTCDEDLNQCVTSSAEGFDKYPVFFVHGHGLSSASWSGMISFLTAQGYPSEFLRAIDLVPDDGPNQAAAQNQIAPAIESFLTDVNAFLTSKGYAGPTKTKVDLVSHSMGALSSRWYAARIAPERVHTWLSLAGANHGTDDLCPLVGPVPTGADDACPAYSSDPADTVQLNLNGQPQVADVDETPYGIGGDAPGVSVVSPAPGRQILYVTIRTEPDSWISPDDSVIIDGAGGVSVELPAGLPATETSPGNFLMTNGVGHDPMTSDAQTMQLVNTLLEAHTD